MLALQESTYRGISSLMHEAIGLSFGDSKLPLVSSRLASRVQRLGLGGFDEYLALIAGDADGGEFQVAVDLLTTNETYFFREPKHFDVLRELATRARGRAQPFRVWSAASSSGEECYSIAMVLADCLDASQTAWDIVGSDISTRVLRRARTGHYPMERARNIPPAYLKRYCLRGQGDQDGTLLVERRLRSKVSFAQVNLNSELPRLGTFDVVFLRNVMIYFNGDTKRQVVARVISLLKPGGHFFIGHSESLNDITTAVDQLAPSVYCKP